MHRRLLSTVVVRLLFLIFIVQLVAVPRVTAMPRVQETEPEPIPPMEYQPPADADGLDDFVPPGISLTEVRNTPETAVEVPLPEQAGIALSFSSKVVAVVAEAGTFPASTMLEFIELSAPEDLQPDTATKEGTPTTTPTATVEATVTATPITLTLPVTVTTTPTATVGPITQTTPVTVTVTPTATVTVMDEDPTATSESPSAEYTIVQTTTVTGTEAAEVITTPITETTALSSPVDSRDLVRFHLEVVDAANDRTIERFDRAVRIVVDLRPFTDGLNSAYNTYYLAYQDETDPLVWHEVPITVHQPDGLISAEVAHFSGWAAGVRPERWNPSWTPPSVSSFSGAATYSYPFTIPPGRNGLQPNVTLSYSSRSLDGHIKDTDPGDVAHGWALAQISVVRTGVKLQNPYGTPQTYHPDKFRLVFNGSGYELYPASGANTGSDPSVRYYAKELPEYHITRYYGSGTSVPNKDGMYWIVIAPDGTRYRLGYMGNAPHNAEEWQQTSAAAHLAVAGHPGHSNLYSAIAWHVDTVTDLYGNQMTFSYSAKTDPENIEWYNVNHWTSFTLTTRSSRIMTIRYNYPDRVTSLPPSNTVAQLTTTPGTRVEFRDRESGETNPIRNIFIYHGTVTAQPMVEYRIESATQQVESPGCINYDKSPAEPRRTTTRTISSIRQYANTDNDPATNDAGYALPATTFSYTSLPHFFKNNSPCFQFRYLTKVKNGYGGEVAFTYQSDSRSVGTYTYYTYDQYEWPAIGYNYYVQKSTSSEGRNPVTTAEYSYSGSCYSQLNGGVTLCNAFDAPEYGNLVGFALVTQTNKGFAGEVLNRQITAFSQNASNNIGQPLRVEVEDSAGILLTCTRTSYVTTTLGGVTNFSRPDVVDSRQYGSDAVCSDVGVGATVPGTVIQSIVNYDYDAYGNVTVLRDHGEWPTTADDRLTTYTYYPNTSVWMVNKLAHEQFHEGISSPILIQETRYFYDGNSSYTVPPGSKGALTKVRQGKNGATLGGSSDGLIAIARYSYDAYGNIATSTSPRDAVTSFTYDAGYHLYPVKVTNQLGHATTFAVYGFKRADGTVVAVDGFQEQAGLLRAVTDPNGVKMIYEYDPFGRLYATYYDGDVGVAGDQWDGDPIVRYRYWDNIWNNGSQIWLNPAGNLPFAVSTHTRPMVYTGTPYALQEIAYYDGFGRVIQMQTKYAAVHGVAGQRDLVVSTAYDARGQVRCQTAPYDVALVALPNNTFNTTACDSKPRTTWTYDALGRQKSETAPDGSVTQFNHYIKTTIDAGPYSRLQAVSIVDPEGYITNHFTNVRGQLVLVREVNGSGTHYADTRYAYNTLGNLTSAGTTTPTDDNPTSWLRRSTMNYDVLGRRTAMNDADMGTWTYTYDASGNLTTQKDARGKKLCFTYDELDRLKVKFEDTTPADGCPAAPTSGSTHLATYVYDTATYGKGQVATISWGASPTQNKDTFVYDSRGRLKKQTRLVENLPYVMETTAFDALDRPLTVKYPNGEIVTLSYDREGENGLTAGANVLVNSVGYSALGQLRSIDRGQGPDLTFFYYGATGSAGNNNFRLKEIRDGASQSDIWPDFFYYYDRVGNIVTLETKFTEGGVLKTDVQNFTYDHRQRLLSASSSGPLSNYNDTYTYDELGNIKTFDGKSYTYGNTAHKQAVTSVTGGWTFGYDANGNMTSRTDGTGAYTQVFDVENRLITVTKSGAGTTKFAYDASGQRVRSEKPNGDIIYTPFPNYEVEVRGAVTIKRNTYTLAGQTIAIRVSGDPASANNGIFYVHADHLGSTTMLGKGSATSPFAGSTTRYLPFGGYRTTPAQAVTDRDFTGQKENRELGLLYYNARYYLPGIGRFVSADTIVPDPGNPQSFNRYAYVTNNPLKYFDPSGHMLVCPADTPCDPGHRSPAPPPVVTFEGEWNDDEMTAVQTAAQVIGNALARAHNNVAMQAHRVGVVESYEGLSSRAAFLEVYGGSVTFKRLGISCADVFGPDTNCFGSWDGVNRQVNVYAGGGVAGNHKFLIHELGHGFESRVNGILGGGHVRNTLGRDVTILRRNINLDDSPNSGFAGPLWGWQQSDQATTGEEFADMYIGWTHNQWETNTRLGTLTPQGQARSRFMRANMPIWTFLVVQH